MFKFAATALLASIAAAVDADKTVEFQREEYIALVDLLPDADEVIGGGWLPHEGRDHTEWSWHHEHKEAEAEVVAAGVDVEVTEQGVVDAVAQYEAVKAQIIPAVEEHHRNCQLHREEEMNLYYQCTQNDINNYALHHFGGQERSYPRWVVEYNVCIDHLQHAKWLWLDFHHDDGRVTLEPCDPQTKTDPLYIEGEEREIVIEEPLPLDPSLPCDKQGMPDWSGIWIEIWGGADEANAILMGNTPVSKTHTERCYTVTQKEDSATGQAQLLETWDHPGSRTYTLTKRRDDRYVENGCMIHTHLDGTDYTQWVAGVSGDLSMADQIMEQWHTLSGTEEDFMSQHHEIKIGTCSADDEGQVTVHKEYYGMIRHE